MRGQTVPVGSTRVSQNGYHYTKTALGWRLTHHIIAENMLGRPIREDERVKFCNGKKNDLRPDNIEVVEKGKSSVNRRKAQLEARIAELQAELGAIEQEKSEPMKVDRSR